MYCEVCGNYDEQYDEENVGISHNLSPKHVCNMILRDYKERKKGFRKHEGVFLYCTAESLPLKGQGGEVQAAEELYKIRMFVKPSQKVKFTFTALNNMNRDVLIVGTHLGHPQPQFEMNKHPYIFGNRPHLLKRKSSLENQVFVTFKGADIGQYEMPIMFTFQEIEDEINSTFPKKKAKKNIILIREMVIMVEDDPIKSEFVKTPYLNKPWEHVDRFVPSTGNILNHMFKIPKSLKILFPINLDEDLLLRAILSEEERATLRAVLVETSAIFQEGITESNYIIFFHNLLWWEECKAAINLRKYNMFEVKIERECDGTFWLKVPGLAEKRPSLLRGDRVIIRPEVPKYSINFQCIIGRMREDSIQLTEIDDSFIEEYYSPEALYNIRFLMSRVPLERMHQALCRLHESQQTCRVFPKANKKISKVHPISKFHNRIIRDNKEQRSAVEHIVAQSSKRVPYIVFGPPGTGKTMTIVEAIVQIVAKDPKNRVLVCTDSNMAADHIAVMLLKYNKSLNINNYLLRSSSQNREWTILPPELIPYSNGTSYDNFYPVTNHHAAGYRILVTTLLHSAKFSSSANQSRCKLQMSHLFIDEAAQAMEPAALVPITGLLAPSGQLVLAGDPQQLGPVCISREASKRGLGKSLLERLWLDHANLYRKDSNYITTLVQNFRSDPDILEIPNELFYADNPLQPKAQFDLLSKISILGEKGGERAIVFHGVNSSEQRMGNTPSYFNERELLMLQKYIKALMSLKPPVEVKSKDIGIITPYIRQVYKMKDWLKANGYNDIEIGTVESFQGKEKRVILVSTVRANCKLLDYDAKYNLGFLHEDKRFNVTLTRAKAKLIIIGNPACLTRDVKWRKYMKLCKDYQTYFGIEHVQLPRSVNLLIEVAQTRFKKCLLNEAMKEAIEKKNDNNNSKVEKNKNRKRPTLRL